MQYSSIYIKKPFINQSYGIPLSIHKLSSFTIFPESKVVTANIESYFNEEGAVSDEVQPLSRFSTVVKGVAPDSEEDLTKWLGKELVKADAEVVEEDYHYPGIYQPAPRNILEGGEVIEITTTKPTHNTRTL